MRALVQRVERAAVTIDGERIAEIDVGILILLGVAGADGDAEAEKLAGKCARLRIFEDDDGRMGRSLLDLGEQGAVLCVSQFTLYGDTRKGTRPSFSEAAPPEQAERLYERFCESLAAEGTRVERGRFGAMMDVALVNSGPVTLMIEA